MATAWTRLATELGYRLLVLVGTYVAMLLSMMLFLVAFLCNSNLCRERILYVCSERKLKFCDLNRFKNKQQIREATILDWIICIYYSMEFQYLLTVSI